MQSQDNYEQSDIPPQIKRFDSAVKQLGVGNTGKVGVIDLEFQKDNADKTIITRQYTQVPFQVQRALYPETSLPQMAYVYIMSTSGGILQGDRCYTKVSLKNNAMVHMTTQGATRVYSMNSNSAIQDVTISVDENCYLEYVPDQIIPYKNSRYYQKVNLNWHQNSTLIYSEILTSGRVGMGESFEYDICYFKTACKDQTKKIRFLDNYKIEPKLQEKRFGIFGDYTITGTVYILTNKDVTDLENSVNKIMNNDVSLGTSILPHNSGIMVRMLGNKTSDIFDLIFKTITLSREIILGTSFSKIRKN